MTDKLEWNWKWNHGLEVMEDSVKLLAAIDEPRSLKLYRASFRLVTLTEDQFPRHLWSKVKDILDGVQGRPSPALGTDVDDIQHVLAKLICQVAFEMTKTYARSNPDY